MIQSDFSPCRVSPPLPLNTQLAGRQFRRMNWLVEAVAVAFWAWSGVHVLPERGVQCGREVNPEQSRGKFHLFLHIFGMC